MKTANITAKRVEQSSEGTCAYPLPGYCYFYLLSHDGHAISDQTNIGQALGHDDSCYVRLGLHVACFLDHLHIHLHPTPIIANSAVCFTTA